MNKKIVVVAILIALILLQSYAFTLRKCFVFAEETADSIEEVIQELDDLVSSLDLIIDDDLPNAETSIIENELDVARMLLDTVKGSLATIAVSLASVIATLDSLGTTTQVSVLLSEADVALTYGVMEVTNAEIALLENDTETARADIQKAINHLSACRNALLEARQLLSESLYGTLHIYVKNPDNKAISGAFVQAEGPESVDGTSDANGFVAFGNIKIGSYIVIAVASGYSTESRSATVYEGQTTTITITLKPIESFGTLSGTVFSPGGLLPVEGAVVQAFKIDGSQHHVMKAWDKTSSTGEYMIEDLPTGTYEIMASAQTPILIYTPRTQLDVKVEAGKKTTVNFVFDGTMEKIRAAPWAVYTHTYDTPDGWFRVHYNSTGDTSSVVSKEYAERVGDAFSHARIFETGPLFNYPEPTRDNGGTHNYEDLNRVAIYVTQHLQGLEGLATVSETSSSIHCFAIVTGLSEAGTYAVAYHEFFHGIQNNYFWGLWAEQLVGKWVFEGTADWMVFQAASKDPYLSQKGYKDLILGTLYLKDSKRAIEFTKGNGNPPEKSLSSRDYDALYYWIFLSQKYGANVVKDLLSRSARAFIGSLDWVLNEKYESSLQESITDFFEKLYLRKTDEGKAFWGDDATKIFTDKELVAHQVTVSPSTSGTLHLTEAISIGKYAAEYVEVYPRDGIDNIHMMFYGDALTNYHLEILGMKDERVLFRGYPATNLFSYSFIEIPQATSYDTLVFIIVRADDLLGLGNYSLEIPKGVLTVSNHSPTRILLVAPDGSKVGYDPELGEFINEISSSIYMNNTEPQVIATSDPLPGEYNVQVTGVQNGIYRLEVALYSNGSRIENQSSYENINSGYIHVYSLEVSSSSIILGDKYVIPEFPTWTPMLLILILVAVAVAIYKRRQHKTSIQ